MKKNLFFALFALLTITLSVFAADWVQIYEKIYLDASSLSQYNYNLNFDNDRIYSIWSKMLNDGTNTWKDMEKSTGKKIWYNKSLQVVNCTKKEFAIKSVVSYDLKENVIETSDSDILYWQSVVPETVGEGIYTFVCRAVAPKFRSNR